MAVPGEFLLRAIGEDDPLVDYRKTSARVDLRDGLSVEVDMDASRLSVGIPGYESLTEGECETGCVVWDGAVVLARYMCEHVDLVRGKRILELGAGQGLVGIACAALGAASVHLTDLSHRINALRRNIERNGVDASAMPLDWTDDTAHQTVEVDIVVCSDCIYDLPLVGPLVETIRRCLHRKDSHALVSVDTSIGRRRAYDLFNTKAEATFAAVHKVTTDRVHLYRIFDPLPTSVVVMGVCGCGKTSTGRALCPTVTFVDGDDLHPGRNIEKMRRGHPLDDEDRFSWLEACAQAIARPHSSPIVLACSALKAEYRARLATAVFRRRRLLFVYLRADPACITARLARRRNHFMNPALVDSQFAALEPPRLDEPALATSGLVIIEADLATPEIAKRILAKL